MKSGQELHLMADPQGAETGTSHTDPAAVAVYVDLREDDLTPIEVQLIASGWSIDDLLADGHWHLGYCAKQTNKEFQQKSQNLQGYALRGCEEILSGLKACLTHHAELEWGPNGEPLVKITI
jgi:hypothetical protein